jgi:hypothetical protein
MNLANHFNTTAVPKATIRRNDCVDERPRIGDCNLKIYFNTTAVPKATISEAP